MPRLGEVLVCESDIRQEAKDYDENAIGVFKEKHSVGKTLVGHVSVEISKLLSYFLSADEGNISIVTVAGHRQKEVGQGSVPGKYVTLTKNQSFTRILMQKLNDSLASTLCWDCKKYIVLRLQEIHCAGTARNTLCWDCRKYIVLGLQEIHCMPFNLENKHVLQ